MLSLESTTARLGSSVLAGMPLLTLDEFRSASTQSTLAGVEALAGEHPRAGALLSATGVGADEAAFRSALEAVAA